MSSNDDQTITNPVGFRDDADAGFLATDHGIAAVIDLATSAAGPVELDEGKVFAVAVPAGAEVKIIDRDRDEYRDRPRHKAGTFTFATADSLIAYLYKHELPDTELWADIDAATITAVIDAHGSVVPGWARHRAILKLQHTPAWKAWSSLDGKMLSQVEFAEFIEQRTIDFQSPSGATVLELAQSFQASSTGSFESSKRLASGETTLEYREEINATAGTKRQLTIPDHFDLALVPFEGGAAYKVKAAFRYRIAGGNLRLGFQIERPEDVLRDAFESVIQVIEDSADTGAPIFRGRTA